MARVWSFRRTVNHACTHSHTIEMRPQWFEHTDIPFPSMWPDDHLWFPYLLSKRYFDAFFKFEGHDKILEYTITEKHHH